MPQTKRDTSQGRNDSPDPGLYQSVDNDFGKSSKRMTIQSRPKTAKVDSKGGPGSYSPNVSVTKDRIKEAFISPNSKRMDFVDKNAKNAPGPGAYQAKEKEVKSFKMGEKR